MTLQSSFVRNVPKSLHGSSSASSHIFSFVKRSPLDGVTRISSGTADLDALLNGGLPCGGMTLMYADCPTSYGQQLACCFLSYGLHVGHDICIVSRDPQHVLSSLPLTTEDAVDKPVIPSESMDKLHIAWRYEKMKGTGTAESPRSFSSGPISFDMTRLRDKQDLDKYQDHTHLFSLSETSCFKDAILFIRSLLEKYPDRVVHFFIAISDFTEDNCQFAAHVHMLKRLLVGTRCSCLLSLPTYLHESTEESTLNSLIPRLTRHKAIEHIADIVIALQSFSFMANRPPSLEPYHGNLSVLKLHPMNSLHVRLPIFHPYVFKLKRRKFSIEPYVPPPEEEDEEALKNGQGKAKEQKTAYSSSPMNCGGNIAHTQHGSVKLDF